MKLIIGLGNPDTKYQNTRHNLGRQIVQKIIDKYILDLKKYPKLNVSLAPFALPEKSLIGLTDTFMNLSGPAVLQAANYFNILPQDILIIHDDLDIKVGEYKLQYDRSPAGHNGIKSTVDSFGTQAFWRLRVGIDHPRHSATPQMAVEDYVLLPFTTEEEVIITQTIDKIVSDLENILSPMGH